MSIRPLSSVALPPGTLAVLTRLGYETVKDLIDVSVETLSKGFYNSCLLALPLTFDKS
jgi:RAD51-like protein 2